MTLVMLLVLLLPNTFAQESRELNLPEGAVARFGKGHVDEIRYSPDSTRLAVISSIGTWLYDTATYQQIGFFPVHAGSVDSVVFSPDGRTLASGSWNRTVDLWDVQTGERKQEYMWYRSSGRGMAFSPDGRTIASASADGTVLVWKVD